MTRRGKNRRNAAVSAETGAKTAETGAKTPKDDTTVTDTIDILTETAETVTKDAETAAKDTTKDAETTAKDADTKDTAPEVKDTAPEVKDTGDGARSAESVDSEKERVPAGGTPPSELQTKELADKSPKTADEPPKTADEPPKTTDESLKSATTLSEVDQLRAEIAKLKKSLGAKKKTNSGSKPRPNVKYILLGKPPSWAGTPQVAQLQQILFDSKRDDSKRLDEEGHPVFTEPEIFDLIKAGHKNGILRTGQNPVRILQYYQAHLIASNCLRVK